MASSSDFAAFSFSFQISYSSTTFFTSIVLFFFGFFFFFLSSSFFCSFSSLLISFSLPYSSLLFVFTTPVFSTLVSTAFHTLLGIFSSLPLLFSSQFQDCSKQVIAFPKSHSTFGSQLYQSLFSSYVSGNIY